MCDGVGMRVRFWTFTVWLDVSDERGSLVGASYVKCTIRL